jgi:hypothetical protein
MLACDAAIASTPGLAEAMRRAGMPEVHVVENGLDEHTLDVTAAVAARRKTVVDDQLVRIVYGSGTDTHDVDFEEAATAIGAIQRGRRRLLRSTTSAAGCSIRADSAEILLSMAANTSAGIVRVGKLLISDITATSEVTGASKRSWATRSSRR